MFMIFRYNTDFTEGVNTLPNVNKMLAFAGCLLVMCRDDESHCV